MNEKTLSRAAIKNVENDKGMRKQQTNSEEGRKRDD
jgi:hypothetical protein